MDIVWIVRNKSTFNVEKLSDLEYEEVFNALDQLDRSMIKFTTGDGPRILCREDPVDGFRKGHTSRCFCQGHLIYTTSKDSDWGVEHLETMTRAARQRSKNPMRPIVEKFKAATEKTSPEELITLTKETRIRLRGATHPDELSVSEIS